MRFETTSIGPELRRAIEGMSRPMAEAARAAVSDAAELAKARGRRSIARAGFGPKWQNALRSRVYPDGPSLRAAALVYHRIGYSLIFEQGGSIAGRPYLWLPTSAVPRGPSGRRLTPRQFRLTGRPLFSVNRPGRPPLLMTRAAGEARSTAMYVGVRSVSIPKMLDVLEAVDEAADMLPNLYDKHLRADG